jgi:uncharacterized protein
MGTPADFKVLYCLIGFDMIRYGKNFTFSSPGLLAIQLRGGRKDVNGRHHASNQRMKRRKALFLAMPIVFVLLCFIYSFIEPHILTVRTDEFAGVDVPDSFDGFRIVFLSDIHYGQDFSIGRVEGAVKKANELRPDIVVLGGDYVSGSSVNIEPVFRSLAGLKAVYGVYAVPGNHDNWLGTRETFGGMRAAGIVNLTNQGRWIDNGRARIRIGGVDDLWTGSQNLEATTDECSRDDFVILASHNPDYFQAMPKDKVDLVLSGHTHGGQVTLFGLWAPFLPSAYGQKYRSGLLTEGKASILVSNGIGTIPPNVRFFAFPQVNLIILRRKTGCNCPEMR